MAVRSDSWMPLYISKYERATSRLSLAEDGAYMRLIRDYWVNGAPPDDDATLARILRIERREWAKLRPVIERFFEVRDGFWFHDTVERELERAANIIEKRRAAGKQGGRPPKAESKPKPNGFSEQKQNGSQTETPARVALPLPPPSGGLSDADASSAEKPSRQDDRAALVERLWACQPVCGGKRKATRPEVAKALASALKRGGDPAEIEAAFRAYYALPDCTRDGGQFARGAAVLLNDDKWRDFLPENGGTIGADWTESRWAVAVDLWRKDGSWDERLGPTPGQPGCRVPSALIIHPMNQGRVA